MPYAKLDHYNYDLLGDGKFVTIRIRLCGTKDPDLVDIMSEIDRNNGRIYVEGRRFIYSNDYSIHGDYRNAYLDIQVEETR